MGPAQGEVGGLPASVHRHRLRQRTLVMLRWLAVAGQAGAVLFVEFMLDFETPLALCLTVIGAAAWLNVVLTLARPMQRLLTDAEAGLQIAFDVVQLALLLGLTGGISNPFSLLLIGPAAVGAAALPHRHALALGALTLACATAITRWHLPLPWWSGAGPELPLLYDLGLWTAIATGLVFTAGYAFASSRESQRMELALAATQAVLAREQRMSALGALAASAAHELGTPLATIQIVAKELTRSVPPDDPNHEDAQLLVSQAERCREILKRLSRQPDSGEDVVARVTLRQLLDEAAEPYRAMGPEIMVTVRGEGMPEPELVRSPEVLHALAAFVENSIDFAKSHVILLGIHDEKTVTIEVADDGGGFSPQVLTKLGEPYVTSRPNAEGSRTGHTGMGLGFFIAKTLLERTGAKVSFRNGKRGGAVVCVCWERASVDKSGAAPHAGPSGQREAPVNVLS